MINNGFLIRNDRFSLIEENVYLLRGHLAPETKLLATLNGKEYPLQTEKKTENVDERYGGMETLVRVSFPKELSANTKFKVYAQRGTEKRLVFAIDGKTLAEKRGAIRYFLDEYTVNTKDDLMRLQGWACAKEAVTVRLLDANGHVLENAVERYERMDVVDLFEEYPVDSHCGFNIEIRPIPKQKVTLEFMLGKQTVQKTFLTSPLAARQARTAALWKKGTEYLRYNGPIALTKKTYNKLFNPAMKPVVYADWIKKHLPSERELKRQRAAGSADGPLFSIVVPLYKTPEEYLRNLVESVLAQSYEKWELVLSDGSGTDSPLKELLAEIEMQDKRIRVIQNHAQLHIAENTNAALRATSGDFIVFSDHDDLLTPNALYEMVQAIKKHPDVQLLYSDEDKIGIGEKYMQPNLKPDFNPDLLCSVNYICHLLVVSRGLYEQVGDLDPAYDGAQDYDFILRCTEVAGDERIVHVPKILYHWRFFEGSTAANPESKTYAFEAGQRAIEAHYKRLGLPATVEQGAYPGIYRTHWHWEAQPLVSVLIPNKDHVKDLDNCLTHLDPQGLWPNLEILVIENNSEEPWTFTYYEDLQKRDSRVRLLTYEGDFNYSAINNFGAQNAKGEYLFLLNNDTEAITEDLIGELMGYAMRPDVGVVGARLYYEDDTIQHAGAIVGWGDIAGHAFVNQPRGESGYQHRVICQQDYSAVTAACMMVRKSVFEKVGGFTEELAVAFNDIDLCLKIRREGYLVVYNPYAEMYHFESKSRGLDQGDARKEARFRREIAIFGNRWPEILRDGDPYYNPNLSMVTQDFSLKHI